MANRWPESLCFGLFAHICLEVAGVASNLRLGYKPPLSWSGCFASRLRSTRNPKTRPSMYAVLLTIEVVVCIAMIGVILLQRSEGGGLGLGTGGGMSGLMTGRGAANVLTRTTVILATIFIGTSIALTLLAKATRTSHPLGEAAPASAPLGTLPEATPSAPTPDQPSATPLPTAPAGEAPALSLPPAGAPEAQPDSPAPATPPAAPASSTVPAPTSPAPAGGGGN